MSTPPASPAAQLRLFGFPPTQARVAVRSRPRSWRVTRGLLIYAAALGLAPLAALVPPHIPWALGVLGAGAYLGTRRLRERHTLLALEGTCPRCEAPQRLDAPERLRAPHRLTCAGCRNDLTLSVDLAPEPASAGS